MWFVGNMYPVFSRGVANAPASHATAEQKLFRVVRVDDPDSNATGTLRLLAKTQMADHLIDAFWKSDFVDRQIRDALVRLFGPEPRPRLTQT
jgi:hypothetical protein